ncbi:hypothetical protein J5X92_01845 [Alteromonas sp. K632G]|jgi:hypothetical protein|uniref:hypothetical protein n=1 Tax=Alteromonas sp. K632G TaxID=2820757 RepID=UPI001AD71641|nr:hypothetical protein [Alteromonas sp. K632G]MBO7920959.1 hypothetical protein [Alteromonas sp. K632G]
MNLINALLAILGLITVASVYFKSDALQACLILIIFIMVIVERRSRHEATSKLWRRLNGNQRTK